MEILHFEEIAAYSGWNVFLACWGGTLTLVGLIILCYRLWKDTLENVDAFLCIFMMVSGIIMLTINLTIIERKPEKYIYARLSHDVSYVEMVENYDFIDHQDDIYKLKVKSQ